MAVKIGDAILCDLIYCGKIFKLFDHEPPDRIGPQSWRNLIFQITSAQNKTKILAFGEAYHHGLASDLGTETAYHE